MRTPKRAPGRRGRVHPIVAVALALALLGTLFDLPQPALAALRPSIVVFYLDDFAPYPKSLWSDPARTPELARFASQGMDFRRASSSTPLCGPARANLLTGQYGHNSGVTRNDIRPYQPSDSVSPRMRAQGYETVFIGKHINLLNHVYRHRWQMKRLSSQWSRFDVIWGPQGRYYNYKQYRKSGTYRYGSAPSDHSSFQAAQRAVAHIRQTSPDKPLFMVVSLFDGHDPLTPLPRFENHPSCRGVAGWSGPAYDEADVSDKPRYVRLKGRMDAPAHDLQDRCESLLTVDWVVGRVRRALVESGRAWNTLQVLTADNGMLMGDHRLVGKTHAYATWVPLYMRWPSVMGNRRRISQEPVSNVDLAPTFCHIAGCSMPAADGRSLLPLITGVRKRLDRRFVYVEMLHNGQHWPHSDPRQRPGWSGVETTSAYDDQLWAYTRYRTGEEELYNVSKDPHRLVNLAHRPGQKNRLKSVRRLWRQVWDGDNVTWRTKLRLGVPPK